MALKITIISGGSGNDRLIKGLVSLYKNCDVKVITNLYDSGKSTGICRKVTNTLGVSDVRKNHSRLYEALTDIPNKSLLEFYNNRYNLQENNELSDVLSLLSKWDLDCLKEYAIRFFKRPEAKKYFYNDFSIANIIYAQMYSEIGYEATNTFFCNLLNIDDFVLCNSFDNVYLKAITESGYIIEDEGDLVDFKNPNDKIVNVFYEGEEKSLNEKAIDRVLNCDLLIISTGTFWSSIYPTLDYKNFYRYINKSQARKIWAINNEEDKDSYGVTSNDFIKKVSSLGLDLSKFTILENLDSKNSLHLENNDYNIKYKHMGNENGKHNPELYAKEILRIYYWLDDNYDKIVFDFDDTVWSRDYKENRDNNLISIENIKLINNKLKDKAMIISGNTYESISKKLYSVFGTDLEDLNFDIWADSNARLYRKNKEVDELTHLEINNKDYITIIEDLRNKFNLECQVDNDGTLFNIKIKPLSDLERKLLTEYLNNILFKDTLNKYIAKIAGTTTVDILHKDNDKLEVYKHCNLKDYFVLYIGDEIDNGNDLNIANMCNHSIHVSDIQETKAIIELLEV